MVRTRIQSSIATSNGDPLVSTEVYLLKGRQVKIESIKFGSSNHLESWYWLWYLDQDFNNHRITIECTYPNGIFGGAIYKSEFESIKKISTIAVK